MVILVYMACIFLQFLVRVLILSLAFVISNEFLRGGVAIAGVGVYYFIIWLFREKLSDQFEFYIN
mgnify:CR=1 FL=1